LFQGFLGRNFRYRIKSAGIKIKFVRNTCPAPAAKRIYQPRNFQTLWCPNESCPGMAKQSPEILTAGYQIIYSFILKGERLC